MAQKRNTWLEEKWLFWFNFLIKLFETIKNQCDPVLHLIDRAAEDVDVIKIEQEYKVLLIA